jgi:hypothetical protein
MNQCKGGGAEATSIRTFAKAIHVGVKKWGAEAIEDYAGLGDVAGSDWI